MYCVYKLTNIINSKKYIGFTKNLKNRLCDHKNCRGKCTILYKAIKKYGWDNFKVSVLYLSRSAVKTLEKETYYIKKFRTNKIGYNCNLGGRCGLDRKISKKTRGKISKTLKKYFAKMSVSQRKKICGGHNLGKHLSSNHKRILSIQNQGKKNAFYGKHHKNSSKIKMHLSHLGKKKGPLSEKTKKRISQKLTGIKRSKSTKLKMSMIRSKMWKIITPNQQTIIIKNLHKWCKQNHLNSGRMVQVSLGRENSHKGYKCFRL